MEAFFTVVILIFSVVAHEIAHGYAAYAFGDKTAAFAGRLTLNPLKHADLFGTFIFPLISYLLGGFLAGWAKPVPYNPMNLRNRYWGEIVVSSAGVLTNFLLALVFAFLLRSLNNYGFSENVAHIFLQIVTINVMLGVFNLLPLPPFDGMRIFLSIFPEQSRKIDYFFEQNQGVFIIVSIFIAVYIFSFLSPFVSRFIGFLVGF